MKFLAPIFLLLAVVVVAAPNLNAKEEGRGVHQWQCLRLGQGCYRDTSCCSGHCVFDNQPFYQFYRQGRCAKPLTTTTRASSPCIPYVTSYASTYYGVTTYRGIQHTQTHIFTQTKTITPDCYISHSTVSTASTSTPCTPSYGYYTDIGTRTTQSAGQIITVTYTSIYTAIYDPPCAFGGGNSPTTTSSRRPTTSTTTPCLPSYSYYTTLERQTTQSAGRAITVTYTTVYTAIFDPPCAFEGGGGSPGPSITPLSLTPVMTTTRASSTTTSPCLPLTFYDTQTSLVTAVSEGRTQTYTTLSTITIIGDPACAFGG